MAKLGAGLLGERYAAAPGDEGEGPASSSDVCVRPLAFRSLVGQGHSEFSSGKSEVKPLIYLYIENFRSFVRGVAGMVGRVDG